MAAGTAGFAAVVGDEVSDGEFRGALVAVTPLSGDTVALCAAIAGLGLGFTVRA